MRASFALDRSGEFHDLPDTTVFDSSMAETSVPEDVTLLFEKFWANIDEQTAASPNLLTAYVRDHS
ncbi:MAG TPA: hypothetical protein PK765_07530 [bacterium]|nr:hypothetical protein [bacterium]